MAPFSNKKDAFWEPIEILFFRKHNKFKEFTLEYIFSLLRLLSKKVINLKKLRFY